MSIQEIIISLFNWIPLQNFAVVKGSIAQFGAFSPELLLAFLPIAILCLLSFSPLWARVNDSPWVFAFTHSLPFFLVTFTDSLGDAGQVIEGVNSRYHMSEPLASWVHYWFFRLLNEPYNIGAKDAIAWSSRVAGFFYALFVAKVSMRLYPEASPTRRLLHRLMFITAGVALLFHGYIENPPLALPAEQLWVLSSLFFLANPSIKNTLLCSGALALATAIHGRVGFLFPALALGFLIPSGSFIKRLTRACVGCATYFGLLAALVGYIFYIEPQHLSGGHLGNITGGGNRKMFVAFNDLFTLEHLHAYLSPMLIAGGLLAPLGAIKVLTFWRAPSRVSLWCFGYLIAALSYLLLWEFDYGPYIDWDLVFSAAPPLILLASLTIIPSKIPSVCFVPILLITGYISNVFAMVANGAPLNLNVVPTGVIADGTSLCQQQGLKRTYYQDSGLSEAIGAPEADVPHHEYGGSGVPFPLATQPFGARFEGYISIPEAGRYRFFLLGQRNVRVRVGGQLLVNRWIDYEWRVSSEREIYLPQSGLYPISIEFFSTNQVFPLQLELESKRYKRRKIRVEELCYSDVQKSVPVKLTSLLLGHPYRLLL